MRDSVGRDIVYVAVVVAVAAIILLVIYGAR